MKGKFKIGDKTRIIDSSKTCNTYRDFFDENGIGKKISQKYAYGVTFSDGEIVTILAVGKHSFSSYPDPHCVIERNDGKVSIINEIGLELVESVADEITINRCGNKVVAKMGKKVGVARCNETDTFDLYTGVNLAVGRLFGKESEVKEVKEVKREAGVGDWIKIVNASGCPFDEYKNGDVLKVVKRDNYRFSDGRAYYKNERNKYASLNEYVVLENYKPHKKPQEEKPKYYNGKVVCVKSKNLFLTVGKIYVFKDGLSKWDNGKLLPQSDDRKPFESFEDLQSWIASDSKFIELVEDK